MAERWMDLTPADRAALDHLEEEAALVNSDHALSPHGSAPLAAFSSMVCRVLHWVSSPACRPNHATWDPTMRADEERRTYAVRRGAAPTAAVDDAALLDWLDALGVSAIHLADGRQINPASVALRPALQMAREAMAPVEVPC